MGANETKPRCFCGCPFPAHNHHRSRPWVCENCKDCKDYTPYPHPVSGQSDAEWEELFKFRGYTTPIRSTEDAYLLDIAEAVARRGTCGRLRVGAVLAREGRILSTGYNGAPAGMTHCEHSDDEPCSVSVHAEANALIQAARHGVASDMASLYLTHAPCYGCAGLIINAGIRFVRFRTFYRNDEGTKRLGNGRVHYHGGA